ncbi:hypothetical protein JW711_01470 [Candidatus Woesearchaeota archaeon]|nr:hypothetical protein [Candidatus Woesearchaeota archaeon]
MGAVKTYITGRYKGISYREEKLLEGLSPERKKYIQQETRAGEVQVEKAIWPSSRYTYICVPIGSGEVLYTVLERYGKNSKSELDPQIIDKEIIQPNILHHIELAKKIKDKKEREGRRIWYPPHMDETFHERGWDERELNYYWNRMIKTVVDELLVSEGAAYSNGGNQEVLLGHEIKFNYALTPEVNAYSLPVYNAMQFTSEGEIRPHITHKGERSYEPLKDTMRIIGENLRVISFESWANTLTNTILDLRKREFKGLERLEEALLQMGGIAYCRDSNLHLYDKHGITPPAIQSDVIYDQISRVFPGFKAPRASKR